MVLRALHNLSKSHLASLHNSPKYNLVIFAKSAKSDLGIPEHRKITMCFFVFWVGAGCFLEFTRSDFVFGPGLNFIFIIWVHDVFQFGCRMFCFSRANLGLRYSPAGK